MLCEYTLGLVCRCPADPKVMDSYRVTVTADRMILAECLLEAAKRWEGRTIYQEDLTRALAQELKARVRTVGRHSGVETTVTCEAPA